MNNKTIRIFNIRYTDKEKEKIKSYFNEVLDVAFLTNHTFCRKLEKAFDALCTSHNSLCCASATAGLEAVFRYLEVKNKAVLVQSNTFIATGHAIQAAGGIIVPIDIDSNYVASYEDIKKAISKCKADSLPIGAVCIVNIAGRASVDLIKIQELCKDVKIPIVEDNAQGMLSTLNEKQLGTFSDFSVGSFQTTKVIACGEGGLIQVKNKEDYENLKNFIFYGKSKNNNLIFEKESGNFKLSELNAALALADFERSKLRVSRRNKIDEIYSKNVNSKFFKFLNSPTKNITSNYKTIFMAEKAELRGEIENHFKLNNVAMTGYVYKIPLHKQPRIIKSKNYIDRQLINTNKFCDCHFTPPNYPELSDEEVNYVCNILNAFKTN